MSAWVSEELQPAPTEQLLVELSSKIEYASHYCEENIYKLALKCRQQQHKSSSSVQAYAVFISNEKQQTPLWAQRMGDPVCWDYHVVFLLTDRKTHSAWVFDSDSALGFCTPLQQYLRSTCRDDLDLHPQYRRCFRVIEAEQFLGNFASDRSHMKEQTSIAPPSWPPIRGASAETEMTLFHFIRMTAMDLAATSTTLSSRYGKVMNLQQMMEWTQTITS